MFDNIEGEVLFNARLAPYTSWKVGGECKALVFPQTIQDITQVVTCCVKNDERYFVMGNGSNILKSDDYFDGVVINISKTLNSIAIEDNKIIVGSGCMLPKLAFHLAKNEIGNYDFYAGIPGTVGGAIVMNAGSAGKETKDVLLSVTYLNEDGKIVREPVDDLQFGFRESKFQGRNTIILSAEFKKEYMDKQEAVKATKEIADRRRKKFPLNVPTAGSTFKSPVGGPYPGEIIEMCGLKGYSIGGAEVSALHANWIINKGFATAHDIRDLITHVSHEVFTQQGIKLSVEIIYV